MSEAKPMTPESREAAYRRTGGPRLTPKQRRRAAKKNRKLAGR